MDMSQYHELFLTETREHLGKISELTLLLETDHTDKTTIDALFRSAHSVKGMAASMGFKAVARVAHKLEDLMDGIRRGGRIDAELFDLLLAGESTLSAMLDDIANGGSGEANTDELLAQIAAYPDKTSAVAELPEAKKARPEKNLTEATLEEAASQKTVKIRTAVLDRLVNTTGELITVKQRMTMLAKSICNQDFSDTVGTFDKHLAELHSQIMAIRLMPLSAVTERLPRIVRDLARNTGKEITFTIKGAEIELDRSILDLLGDPLSHLLRNSVDHGIETPQERSEKGKSPVGRINISVYREKDQVEIRVEDDGRGMIPEKILAVAVAKGLLPKERGAALTETEVLMLICQPGFSTAEKVSDISGRGVGMDVVKTAVQGMGGSLSIMTTDGKGSCFLLRLPLTIAIINVLLVKVGCITVAIPLTAIDRTIALNPGEFAAIDGQEVFFLEGAAVPIIPLNLILNIPASNRGDEPMQIFVIEVNGEKSGIMVDQLLGNQEVFVKPLKRPLSILHGINGATIIGTGEVVFIFDILSKTF